MTVLEPTDGVTIHVGDVRQVLPTLPAESVDLVATSPPFFGLRDYGADGQIGLEATPEQWAAELVAVFRECRRLLRPGGSMFVECGDSYCASSRSEKASSDADPAEIAAERGYTHAGSNWANYNKPGRISGATGDGLKPKDLLGQPFLLAFALRGPWYMGRITNDLDRVWLAAMVDAEGCIHIHRRKAGEKAYANYTRKDGTTAEYMRNQDSFGVMVSVSNTSRAIVERCMALYGLGSIHSSEAGTGVQKRKQTLHRWTVTGDQARDLLREIYTHLVAKQHEARIALGCPTQGDKALAFHEAIKALHNGREVDLDAKAPASMWEPGFYWRGTYIWSKSNGMPESAKDRCTSSHSYVLHMSKAPRYFFDADAISEPASWERWGDQTVTKHEGTDTASGWIQPKTRDELRLGVAKANGAGHLEAGRSGTIIDGRALGHSAEGASKHPRSVWTIPTYGFPGAHFAVFPPRLVERMILAGCPREVCSVCGKARERLTERGAVLSTGGSKTGARAQNLAVVSPLGQTAENAYNTGEFVAREHITVGFTDCGHDAYQPGTVLDPFFGSGTTGVVALRHGRHAIGVELNPTYARMAADRCAAWWRDPVREDEREDDGQLSIMETL